VTRRGVLALALCAALSAGGGVALAAFSDGTQNQGSTFAAASQFPPTIVSVPDLKQTAQVGTPIPVTTGLWSYAPSGYAYSWLRCDSSGTACTTLSATASSYTPVAADIGYRLRSRVTPIVGGSPLGSGALTELSQTVKSSDAGPVILLGAVPAISGTFAVGATLSVSTGAWSALVGPSYSYQWLRCDPAGASCATISSATASSYTLQTADRGARVRARVFASGTGLQQNWILTQDVGPVT
jgi:hypothetical protein